MTFDSFMHKMLEAFPLAEVGEDNDGQLIVYTGLTDIGDDVVPMPDNYNDGLPSRIEDR